MVEPLDWGETTNVASVVFARSAYKHGITPDEALHALRYLVRAYDLNEVTMVIGPARDGAMLEAGLVDDEDEPRVIHVMRARRKFWPWQRHR